MIRTATDRCPGVLRPWDAEDGPLVRIRLPGGRLSTSTLSALGDIADRYADGRIFLTSRGNVQLRSVGAGAGQLPDAFVSAVADAGLLPSRSHDRVRNITCSPLTGRVGGYADFRPLVQALDDAIVGSAEFAKLPGKFLFALDDGSHDIASGDLTAVCETPDRVRLFAGEFSVGVVAVAEVVPEFVRLARRFLQLRGEGASAAWHIAELADGGRTLADTGAEPATMPAPEPWELGEHRQRDGRVALHIAVPDGVLTSRQARGISADFESVVITPERSMMLVDLVDPIPKVEL